LSFRAIFCFIKSDYGLTRISEGLLHLHELQAWGCQWHETHSINRAIRRLLKSGCQ
jgi:DNA-binding HxlR family transcriptional regulator